MITINKILNYSLNEKQELLLYRPSLIFDIETTGFSAAKSSLYLIGCLFFSGNEIRLTQFFAEKKEDEPLLLNAFKDLAGNFHSLVSFNGLGFDVPYLKQKCQNYQIDDCFLDMVHEDYYVILSPLKNLFGLENFKQKTVEAFLDTGRKDPFNGGQLIETYRNYRKNPNQQALEEMLLHNEEDVLGLLSLVELMNYRDFFIGAYVLDRISIHEYTNYLGNAASELEVHMTAIHDVPKDINYRNKGYQFLMKKDRVLLCVPIIDGNVKYYYPNYKEYWYFPEENIAVHKSVAAFASRKDRIKATPETACQYIPVEKILNYDENAQKTFLSNQFEYLLM